MASSSRIVLRLPRAKSSDNIAEPSTMNTEEVDREVPQDRSDSTPNNIVDSIETELPKPIPQRRKPVPITRKLRRGRQTSSSESVSESSEQLRQLRQVTKRLLARAEEAVMMYDGRVPDELEQCLTLASDLMIDMISVIEQKGGQDEVVNRWEQEQEAWARKYALQ